MSTAIRRSVMFPAPSGLVRAYKTSGQLSDVTTIQNLNTGGGTADGLCETIGIFLAVPYAADYDFA